MKLKASKLELKKAISKLEKMRKAESMDEFEEHWTDFLNSLEKVWIKAERECQPFKNKFQPFQGKFKNLRRRDPLLKYLKNARDADVHSIQEIIKKEESRLKSVTPVYRKSTYIKRMEIRAGKITDYEGDPIIVESTPNVIKTKSFTNHGIVYVVPTIHRGAKIANPYDASVLAELGIHFYSDFLDQIEKNF